MNRTYLENWLKISLVGGVGLLLCVAVLLASTPRASFGKSVQEQRIEKIRQERNVIAAKVQELGKQKIGLLDEISRIDQLAEEWEADLKLIAEQISLAQDEVNALETRKVELESQLTASTDNLAERAVAIYVQGDLSYAELLLQSASFGEFIDRMFFVQAVLEHDRELIEFIGVQRKEINVQKDLKASQLAEIETIQAELLAQQAELDALRQDRANTVTAISQDMSLYLQQIKELEAESNRVREEIRNIANSASGNNSQWTGSLKRPLSNSHKVTSGYGMRTHPIFKTRKMHTGVDIGAPKGTTIKAAGKGKVIFTGTRSGYGKTVMVDHGRDPQGRSVVTLYAHMSRITCDAGDSVVVGDKLGEVGSTGYSTGNHLHFELRINGEHVNPMSDIGVKF